MRRERTTRAGGVAVIGAACALICFSAAFGDETGEGGEPPTAEPGFSLSVLSYNVHGLFRWIAADDPRDRSPTIGWLARKYDVVLLQEDFEYHRLIAEQFENATIYRGNGMRLDPRLVAAKAFLFPVAIWLPHFSPPYGAGLSAFVKHPAADSVELARRRYDDCSDWLGGMGDCWATKGFQTFRMRFPDVGEVDVYNTHLEAGKDKASAEARARQLEQLAAAIGDLSANRAVILGADVNSAFYRPRDREVILDFRDRMGLLDSGAFPQTPHWRERDVLLYRSGDGVALRVEEAGEDLNFVSGDRALSDHPALFARFRISRAR